MSLSGISMQALKFQAKLLTLRQYGRDVQPHAPRTVRDGNRHESPKGSYLAPLLRRKRAVFDDVADAGDSISRTNAPSNDWLALGPTWTIVIHAPAEFRGNGMEYGRVIVASSDLCDRAIRRLTRTSAPAITGDAQISVAVEVSAKLRRPQGIEWLTVHIEQWHGSIVCLSIWPDLCTDNLDDMARLRRSYGRRTRWHECWGRELLLSHRAREKRRGW